MNGIENAGVEVILQQEAGRCAIAKGRLFAIRFLRLLLDVPMSRYFDGSIRSLCFVQISIQNFHDHAIRVPNASIYDAEGDICYAWNDCAPDRFASISPLTADILAGSLRSYQTFVEPNSEIQGWLWFDPLPKNAVPYKVSFGISESDASGRILSSETLDFEIVQYTLCLLTSERPYLAALAKPGGGVHPTDASDSPCTDLTCLPNDYRRRPKAPPIPQYGKQGPYYQQIMKKPAAARAVGRVEGCLLQHDWDGAIALLDEAADLIGQRSLFDESASDEVEFSRRLLDYPFSELRGVDRTFIQCFAARWSYGALMDASFANAGIWAAPSELLAMLLGRDYDIDLGDAVARWSDTLTHSSSHQERSACSPAYPLLRGLSYNARRCIALSVGYNYRGDIVKASGLKDCLRAAFASAVDECVKAGLLAREVDPRHYLYHLDNKTLADIAAEHGLKAKRMKADLVVTVSEGVPLAEIARYVHHVMDSDDVRVCFTRWKPLLDLLATEMHRIDRWDLWLQHEHLTDRLPWSVTRAEFTDPEVTYDNFQRIVDFPQEYLDQVANLPLWSSYWDQSCDDVVAELAPTLGWNAFKEATDVILARWGDAKASRFKADSQALLGGTPMAGWDGVWKSVIEAYCEYKRKAFGIEGPSPATQQCAHCGQEFNQASIPPGLARLAGYSLNFCRKCLTRGFYYLIYGESTGQRESANRTISREQMLTCVVTLADSLEMIPMASFVQSPRLSRHLDREQAGKVINALIVMPRYSQYIQEFGSWFKVLRTSGLFQDDAMRMARGYRTIAGDGHDCYSLAERTIDDWLSSKQILHEREPYYPLHYDLNPRQGMRADWLIGQTYVEYFGLLDDPDYREKAERKRQLARMQDLDLIEITPQDIVCLDGKLGRFLQVT